MGGGTRLFVDRAGEVDPEGVPANKTWISVFLSSLKSISGQAKTPERETMNVNAKVVTVICQLDPRCAINNA